MEEWRESGLGVTLAGRGEQSNQRRQTEEPAEPAHIYPRRSAWWSWSALGICVRAEQLDFARGRHRGRFAERGHQVLAFEDVGPVKGRVTVVKQSVGSLVLQEF